MSNPSESIVRHRVKAALQLSFIGDALAMPVHWYYQTPDIFSAFAEGIYQFEAAPAKHPMTFMSLKSADDDNGREVIGSIILKDKRKFWDIPNEHVHQGMHAGENTLNLHCLRLVMRTLAQNHGRYDANKFLDHYIAFMTAVEPQHPDTYAEIYHRVFFSNLAKGLPRDKCGVQGDEAALIGGLVTTAAVAISELLVDRNLERVQKICHQHLFLTHPHEKISKVCDAYVELIDALLFRADDGDSKSIIAKIATKSANLDVEKLSPVKDDNQIVGEMFAKACPVDDSWPGVLHFAYKYNADPKGALLANTNVGGENCHRGAVLGVILGLSTANGLDKLFSQLADAKAIHTEISSINL